MRILCISHSSLLSGAELAFYEMVFALNGSGYEISAVFPEPGPLVEKCTSLTKQIFYLKTPWWYSDNKSIIKKLKLFIQILISAFYCGALFKKIKPSAIIINTSVIPSPAIASFFFNIKAIWFIHETGNDGFKYTFGETFTKKLIGRMASKVICNSFYVAENYSKFIPPVKVSVIYQPVNIVKVENEDTDLGKEIIFGIIGRLSPQKNQKEAVNAFALWGNKRAKLILIGADKNEYADEIRAFIKEKGISEQVIFTGQLNDITHVLSKIHVVIACGYYEGLGRSLIEGMKAGKPAIAPCAYGYKELLINDFNGLFYQHNNPLDLRLKMQSITNPDLWFKYSRNAMEWANENFNTDRFIQKLNPMLNEA